MQKYFLLALIPLALLACKKKEIKQSTCEPVYYESNSNDTILPSDYIMAYPGSEWNYDNGTTETCDSWEQAGLVVTSTFNNCTAINTTWTTLPETSFGFIHGVNELKFLENQSTIYAPLLATTPGVFYDYHGYFGSGNYAGTVTDTRTVIELLDSMIVAGVTYYDVIHVHEYHKIYYYHISSGPQSSQECYYAHGVGLIRSEQYGGLNGPIIANLVSYVIGPH